jgi:hypothetical protein
MLHRRQYKYTPQATTTDQNNTKEDGNNNNNNTSRSKSPNSKKTPIKEDRILIKSPLRNSFLSRSTPRQSVSRKDSIKIVNDEKTTLLTENKVNNEEKKDNSIINSNSPATTTKKATEQETHKISTVGVIPATTSTFSSMAGRQNSTIQTSIQSTSPVPVVVTSRPPVVTPKKKNHQHDNRARKALRTITFILGAFVFCFAPWHVITIINSLVKIDSVIYMHIFNLCYFLCYLNSPMNPFMYALANQQFKKTFTRILKGDWRKT